MGTEPTEVVGGAAPSGPCVWRGRDQCQVYDLSEEEWASMMP